MKYLKLIKNSSEIVEQKFNVLYYDEVANAIAVKGKVPPVIVITTEDATDTSVIALTCNKSISVEGEITWSTDLADGVAEIANGTLRFLQHYDGTVKLTATADNASAEKTITVTCDEVATSYTYSVSNVSSPTVAWNVTSATVTFTGTTVAHYEMKADETVSAPQTQVVEFGINEGGNPMDLSNPNTEYVDLGLPSGLKWAKCNLGASTEEGTGAYFSWGDTKGYAKSRDKGGGSQRTIEDTFQWNDIDVNYTVNQNAPSGGFSWSTYKWCNDSSTTLTKYNNSASYGTVDNLMTLEAADDAAHVHMGGNWRMPTTEDTVELYNNTTSTWIPSGNTEFNGVAGRKFVSETDSSKYIFIPAVGYCLNSSVNLVGSGGYVWSSSLRTDLPLGAYSLVFSSYYVNPQDNGSRFYGFPVRGVLLE